MTLKFLNVAGTSSLQSGSGNRLVGRPTVDAAAHSRELTRLARAKYWTGQKSIRPLWPHQQAALSHTVAYLLADRRLLDESAVSEAALLKLPTGSGKSGIIAILSRCLTRVRKVLLLTPRTALTEQLLQDVRWRFWNHIGFDAAPKTTWSAPSKVAGLAVDDAMIERLLPGNVSLILDQVDASDKRVVLVSTLQTLDAIRRAARATASTDEERVAVAGRAAAMIKYLSEVDLVVVDEGHYEPAPSWSRAIRALDRPTVLLSATPFRNDYKSFRVRGRFVYNLPMQEAVDSKIVRAVEFPEHRGRAASAAVQNTRTDLTRFGDDDDESSAVEVLTPERRQAIPDFVETLRHEMLPALRRASVHTPKGQMHCARGFV